MNQYVGLDVSMKETWVCVVDGSGALVAEGRVATDGPAIAAFVRRHAPAAKRVGLETGSLSSWLWRELSGLGLPVVVIDARHAHAGLKLQLNKTDRQDARGLAQIMRAGWYRVVEVRSRESQLIRDLLAARGLVLRLRMDVENQIRGLLKGFGLVVGRVASGRFGARVRDMIAGEAALAAIIEPLLYARENLLEQFARLDRLAVAGARQDPVVRRLMGVPGVGVIAALSFRAAVDDPHRFARARTVGAYLGLTPRRHASGEVDWMGRISKCGDRHARTALYQAANVLLSRITRWCALKTWALRLKKRSGHKKAVTALARKLAVVLARMWRDGTDFRWASQPAA